MFFTKTFCVRGKATTRRRDLVLGKVHCGPLQAFRLAKGVQLLSALLQCLANFGATTVAGHGHPVGGL